MMPATHHPANEGYHIPVDGQLCEDQSSVTVVSFFAGDCLLEAISRSDSWLAADLIPGYQPQAS